MGPTGSQTSTENVISLQSCVPIGCFKESKERKKKRTKKLRKQENEDHTK